LTLLVTGEEKLILPEMKQKFLYRNIPLPSVDPIQFMENTFKGKSLKYCLCKEMEGTVILHLGTEEYPCLLTKLPVKVWIGHLVL